MDIVYVILLTLVTQAAGLYYESSSETTWYNATFFCDIALPDINIEDSGNYITTDYQIENGRVWVGYFRRTTSFEYIGCSLIDNPSITKIIPETKNTPGLCYTFCKNKKNIAGISGNKCYCLSERPNGSIRESRCNLTCDKRGVACGGNGYISLYKAREDIAPSPNDGRCYVFKNDGWSEWDRCSNSRRSFCIIDDAILDIGSCAWNECTNKCFLKRGNMVTFEYNQKILNATDPSWKNIVSSTAFYSYKDLVQATESEIEFAYVSSSKKELKFEDDANKRMRVLCLNETSSSDINGSSNSTEDIAVPVGISVAVVVLITCGILAFLYIKRSEKRIKRKKREQLARRAKQLARRTEQGARKTDDERSPSCKDITKTFANCAYDQTVEAVHTTNTSQDEAAVNSETYMVIEDVDNYPVDTGSTYDTTTATGPRFDEMQDKNLYNKLELEDHATYGGEHTKEMSAKGPDQTYNTVTGATNVHTTSSKDKNYKADENTYNHMNSNTLITRKPDSTLYDSSNQNTRTYRLGQNDTYSHLTNSQ